MKILSLLIDPNVIPNLNDFLLRYTKEDIFMLWKLLESNFAVLNPIAVFLTDFDGPWKKILYIFKFKCINLVYFGKNEKPQPPVWTEYEVFSLTCI